ncbi:carboxylating nicotinate-nucleotide diphosphorylase [Persicirhabdus sediminis]|nr:carboxylating nicotinate-nucleotide diphosphorylase [Persicirhabdus sediminis]
MYFIFRGMDVTSKLIDLALVEDIGTGDVTTEYFVPEGKEVTAYVMSKGEGIVAGVAVAMEVFERVDRNLKVEALLTDGAEISYGEYIIKITGSARSILTAERTVLNFLQQLSGEATKTSTFVKLTEGTKAKILDTRKTTPGWRYLEKMAVRAGGGTNHRMGLYDRAMVKDNHLVAEGGLPAIQDAINKLAEEKPHVQIELEADTLEQVESFLKLDGVDYILLDNMTNEQMRQALEMRGDAEKPLMEASGGVTLETVRGIAKTGVDFISVGALTHSAIALDISMEFYEKESSKS